MPDEKIEQYRKEFETLKQILDQDPTDKVAFDQLVELRGQFFGNIYIIKFSFFDFIHIESTYPKGTAGNDLEKEIAAYIQSCYRRLSVVTLQIKQEKKFERLQTKLAKDSSNLRCHRKLQKLYEKVHKLAKDNEGSVSFARSQALLTEMRVHGEKYGIFYPFPPLAAPAQSQLSDTTPPTSPDENLASNKGKKRKGKGDAGAVSNSTAGALETFNEGTGQRESLIVPPESTSTDNIDNKDQHKSLVFDGSEKPFYQQDYVQKAVISCTVFADAMVKNSGIYQALHNPEITQMARNIHHKGIHKVTFDLAKKRHQQSQVSVSSSNTVKNVEGNQAAGGRRVANTSSSTKNIRSKQAAKSRLSTPSMEARLGELKRRLQNSASQSFKKTNLYDVSRRAASPAATKTGIYRGSGPWKGPMLPGWNALGKK